MVEHSRLITNQWVEGLASLALIWEVRLAQSLLQKCYQRNSTKHYCDELGSSQFRTTTLEKSLVVVTEDELSEEQVEAANRVVIFTMSAVCPD